MGRGKVGSLYLGIREHREDVVSAFSVGRLRQEREGGGDCGDRLKSEKSSPHPIPSQLLPFQKQSVFCKSSQMLYT